MILRSVRVDYVKCKVCGVAMRRERAEAHLCETRDGDKVSPGWRQPMSNNPAFDFEAIYIIRSIQRTEGRTQVFATLGDHPTNRIAVCADREKVYGWEDACEIEVRFTIERFAPALREGQAVKIQSSNRPAEYPAPYSPPTNGRQPEREGR